MSTEWPKLNDKLLDAVEKECIENVRLFLSRGSNPTAACNSSGQNCFGIAALKGNAPILDCLLAHATSNHSNDDQSIYEVPSDDDNEIGLEWDEEIDTIQAFSPDKEWLSLYSYYARMWENIGQVLNTATEATFQRDIHSLDSHHLAPIHYAAKFGHISCVKLLISEYNCPVDLMTDSGQTALQMACENQQTKVVRFLLQSGADPNRKTFKVEDTGLLKAAKNGNNRIVQLLIYYGANINVCNAYDVSPLIGATFFGHVETVKLLLKCNANVNLQDRDGLTALVIAVHNESVEIVRALLQHGARLLQSHNLLHTAINLRNNDLIQMLIVAGENLTRNRDSYGLTPIEKLIQQGNESMLYFCAGFNNQLNAQSILSNREICLNLQIDDVSKFNRILLFLLNKIGCCVDQENVLITAVRLKKYNHFRCLIRENLSVFTEFDYEIVDLLSGRDTEQNLNFLRLLVNSGFRIHKMVLPRKRNNSEVLNYLHFAQSNPLSLQQILRIQIRQWLKPKVKHWRPINEESSQFRINLENTGLPKLLLDYIYCFPDLSS